MGITSGEDKLFCRAWIWTHLQITSQPLGPARYVIVLCWHRGMNLAFSDRQEGKKQSGKGRNICHKHPHTWGVIWEMIWVSTIPWRQEQCKLLLMTRLTTHQTGKATPRPSPRQSQKEQLLSAWLPPHWQQYPHTPSFSICEHHSSAQKEGVLGLTAFSQATLHFWK